MAELVATLTTTQHWVLAASVVLLGSLLLVLLIGRLARSGSPRSAPQSAVSGLELFPAQAEPAAAGDADVSRVAASTMNGSVSAQSPPHMAQSIVVAPAVRRRPKPAWELHEAGQTPAGLLTRAHELLAAGAEEEAAQQLRACVRLASKTKEHPIEASARLELGDLARAAGDLTTACEHWQIARSLFADLKRTADATGAEKRMERAGCPTDWVLTKF